MAFYLITTRDNSTIGIAVGHGCNINRRALGCRSLVAAERRKTEVLTANPKRHCVILQFSTDELAKAYVKNYNA